MPAEVYLDDEITDPYEAREWGIGLDAATFRARCSAALQGAAAGELVVCINSPGGNVAQGLEIYNYLAQLRASGTKITTKVVGWAASMAGVIACAGAPLIMMEASIFMIHNPHGGAYGDAEELREAAAMLEAHASVIMSAYRSKVGGKLGDDALKALMDAESWLTPQVAAQLGFADQVQAAPAAGSTPPAARWQPDQVRGRVARAVVRSAQARWPRPTPAALARPSTPEPTPPPVTTSGGVKPKAKDHHMADPKRLSACLTALSGLLALAQEGASSTDPVEAQFCKDLAAAVPPMASQAQQLLEQAEPGASAKVAKLPELLELRATAAEVVGQLPEGAGLAGALRGLRARADSVQKVSAEVEAGLLLDQAVQKGQVHPDDKPALLARYKSDLPNLKGFLAVAPVVHARSTAPVATGEGQWDKPPEENDQAKAQARSRVKGWFADDTSKEKK